MNAESSTTGLFWRVDDRLGAFSKEPQGRLHRGGSVTLGLLVALKGRAGRPCYRGLSRDGRCLFLRLLEWTRLFRLIGRYCDLADQFLADTGIFGAMDSFGIELVHPFRKHRSDGQIGRKGLSNHRWIFGAKMCVARSHLGLPVSWAGGAAHLPDQAYYELTADCDGEMPTLADNGFPVASGDPANLIICQRGEHTERMVAETFGSLLTSVRSGRRLYHRTWDGLASDSAYALAVMALIALRDGLCSTANG